VPNPFSQVFLGYSDADKDMASELKNRLEADIPGLKVFMAGQDIPRGEDWERRVHSSLKESFVFVPIITKNWQESRWCFAEWVAASVLGEVIVPFVEIKTKLRSELRRFEYLKFNKEDPNYDELVKDIGSKFTQHKAKKDFTRSPFPYAFQYGPDDAELFRGRDNEIDKVVSRLNAMRHSYDRRPLILHGSSGCGKSSLIRAGLYPKLRRHPNLWIAVPLFKTIDKPFDKLLDGLYQSLKEATPSENLIDAIEGIRSATEENLGGALEGVVALIGAKSLVLIVDNLDRYFNSDSTHKLFALLRAAISTSSIKVIGVLRSDQLPKIPEMLDLSTSEYDSICIIQPDLETLISSMNEVLLGRGYAFDGDLIRTIYADAGARMEAWRLIGRYLNDMWITADDRETAFQLTSYRRKGGIGGYIQGDLQLIENYLNSELENFFDFLAMEGISHIEGSTIVPRPIPVGRIKSEHRDAINSLVEKGLMVAGNMDTSGEAVIEVLPAVMERYWVKARIVARVNGLEELLEARRAADQWKRSDHQVDWLIHRGKRLSHVKQLMETKRLAYSELNTYLKECEKYFETNRGILS
jgi:hypothetical protein